MPKIIFSEEIKIAAKSFKLNLSKVIYQMFSDLSIEDMDFILNVFAVKFDPREEKDADCGEVKADGRRKTPREFRIRIKDDCETSIEFVMLLRHEIEHLKQFLLHELVISECQTYAVWDGQKKILANYPYRLQVWERRANKAADDFCIFFAKNRREFSTSI